MPRDPADGGSNDARLDLDGRRSFVLDRTGVGRGTGADGNGRLQTAFQISLTARRPETRASHRLAKIRESSGLVRGGACAKAV